MRPWRAGCCRRAWARPARAACSKRDTGKSQLARYSAERSPVAPAGALALNAQRAQGDKIEHAGSHAAIARLGELAHLDEPRGDEVLAPLKPPATK